jgi:SSS family solute:Na+ symporter
MYYVYQEIQSIREIFLVNISKIEIAILAVFLILVLGVGFYFAQRRQSTTGAYFLAGKNMGWFAIGFSLLATDISAEHFIRLSGYGATRGLAIGSIEWISIFFILMLGWFVAPLILRSGVFTVPEFLGNRFNTRVRTMLSTISIIVYVFLRVSITLYAGGYLLEKVFGLDLLISTVTLVVITGLYTIVGGMNSVVYTSVLQGFFVLIGATALTVTGLVEVGGLSALQTKLPASFFGLLNPVSDSALPWTGIILGAPILAIWYWWTDQYMVQRILCARDIEQARRGTILTGFLKILPVFIIVLPGLIAAVIYPGLTGSEAFNALLRGSFLPAGVRGLLLVGILAALMSSLSAVFISTATLFTMDFYKRFKPKATENNLVLVGRLATTGMVIMGILWIPAGSFITAHLLSYQQNIPAYIGPPIAAVFVLALLWNRINARGAVWALIIGEVLGIWRMIVEIRGITPLYLNMLASMNYLHFAVFSFMFSVFISIVVSLFPVQQPAPLQAKISYSGSSIRFSTLVISRNDLVLSALLIFIVLGLWGSFL